MLVRVVCRARARVRLETAVMSKPVCVEGNLKGGSLYENGTVLHFSKDAGSVHIHFRNSKTGEKED